ncbi:hypothetical protein WJX73_007632 [Symbiochloris irregularis]|uniref:BTB domain-containing protein n=1 Tax=Symbiochloris irregularis TaxID=706552 RepID=A0AAW1PJH9_9CHLO
MAGPTRASDRDKSKKRKSAPTDVSAATEEPRQQALRSITFAHLDTFQPEQQTWLQNSADVQLDTNTGVSIPVHGASLLQWSGVLSDCITGTVPSSLPGLSSSRQCIPVDTSHVLLTVMLRLLYSNLPTDKLQELMDTEELRYLDVMRVAHKYDVKPLLDSMETLAIRTICSADKGYIAKAQEAIFWVGIAHELNLDMLTTCCEDVLLKSPKIVAGLTGVDEIPASLLLRLLRKSVGVEA